MPSSPGKQTQRPGKKRTLRAVLITALLLPVFILTLCLFTQVCNRPVKLLIPLLEKVTAPFPLCQLLPVCGSSSSRMPDASEFFFDPQALAMARAIKAEDTAAIEALAKRLDINARHHRGMTYLMWSLAQLKYASFKKLLALGADYNMKVEKKSIYGFALMLPSPTNPGLSDPRWIIALVEAGWDPNQRTEGGTPLWWDTLYSPHMPVLDYLIEHGNLDVNARDIVGSTATMELASVEQYRRIMKLLELGAELNPKKGNGASFALRVQNNPVAPDSPEYPYREKILQMLKDSGVQFPVLSPYEKEQLRKQQEAVGERKMHQETKP